MSGPHGGLDALAQAISSRIDATGGWSLSADEVIRALGVDAVEFWRALASVRERVAVSDAVDGFTQDSVGDLVTIAERICGPAAEAALSRAGVFLPHGLRVELLDQLLVRADLFSRSHPICADELAAMVRFAGSVSRALPIWLDEHADVAAMIRESALSFARSRAMPDPGRSTCERLLNELLARHIVDRRALFAVLARRLREEARRLGFTDPDEPGPGQEEGGRSGRRAAGGPDPRGSAAWAKAVLGLGTVQVTSETIRRAYRELIMRWHPDVNPSGLERCKDITAAYSILAAGASLTPPARGSSR